MPVLEILQRRKGRDKAITGKELAKLLGQANDRAIRQEIRKLIAQGHPIAATTEPPYGYFMVDSIEEAERYMSQLKSRLIEDAYRRRDFKRAVARTLNGNAQLKLL